KRRARLRSAELSALLGQTADAGREAAGWLRAHTEAPASERARALCLDASMRSRRGDFDAALDRVAEAEAAASSLPVAERLEAGLVRAAVYSAAGRLREEAETYALWHRAVVES